MYNTHLEFHSFHSQSDDQTRLLQSGWLLFWTAVRDNGTVVCLSYPTVAPRTASASICVVKFDTVGGPVMACMHGTGRSSRRRSTQLSARSCVPKLTATALLAVSLTVYQRPTIQHPSLSTSKMAQRGQAAAFPELECQLVE